MKQKIVLWTFIACIIASSTLADIVINQILPNPINTESGGEAIELYNNGNTNINISGWIISTEASVKDAEIPKNTIICAECYYLIADKGWNESRDNLTWPEADLETPLTMYNSNSGIALINKEETIDAVGWGNPDEITDGLFKQTPSDNPNEGNSLTRTHTTHNNKFDFEESVPFFRSSSDLGTGSYSEEVIIEFEISNTSQQSETSIESVNLSTNKLTPIPGGKSSITVNAIISGDINNVTANLLETTKEMVKEKANSTASFFSASFQLDYFTPPGTYPVIISAEDTSETITFEYLELVAIELSNENINFGQINSEQTEEIKIKNIGNIAIDIGIKSNLNIQYSFNNNYKLASSSTVINKINLSENSETTLKLKLTPPSKTGKYDGKITITAIGKN